LPNGTSTAASWQATNAADPTNASKILIATNGSTDVQLVSGINGTGTYLPLTFYTNGAEKMRLDTSGNLGLGVTPSAWATYTSVLQSGRGSFTGTAAQSTLTYNAYYNSGWKYVGTGDYAQLYEMNNTSGAHTWKIAGTGTAGNAITFTQAMTLDASGNLGVGTTSPASYGVIAGYKASGTASYIVGANGGGCQTAIGVAGDNESLLGTLTNHALRICTNSTERARITSTGKFQVGATSLSGDNIVYIENSSATGYGISVAVNSNSSTTYRVFEGVGSGPTQRIAIYTNGDVKNTNNSYGALSDQKLKQDIVDAGSQWNDIKQLRIRKYRLKEFPDAPLQMGLIAQEAELVSPGLVTESPDEIRGEDGSITFTGDVTKAIKYSVLYMKAVKALQEAMNRIEQLEADVAALKGNA
jgi:hypothetical protein